MARRNNNPSSRRRNRGKANRRIGQEATASRLVRGPNDPPEGTPSVVQTIRQVAGVSTTGTSGTVTVANFYTALASQTGVTIPTQYRVKIKRIGVYSGEGSDFLGSVLTVTDLLPNNDGLIITDSGTAGQSRAQCSYVPTLLDRMASLSATSTQAIFSWATTATLPQTATLTVVLTVEARAL